MPCAWGCPKLKMSLIETWESTNSLLALSPFDRSSTRSSINAFLSSFPFFDFKSRVGPALRCTTLSILVSKGCNLDFSTVKCKWNISNQDSYEETNAIWSGPTDIQLGVNVNSDKYWKCYMRQCPDKSWNHISDRIFNALSECADVRLNILYLRLWVKPNFGPNLGLKVPQLGLNFFWLLILPESARYCCGLS